MNYYLKLFIILFIIFLISLMIQSIDDKKYNIKRTCYYDRFKNPILLISILGLLFTTNILSFDFNDKNNNKFNENINPLSDSNSNLDNNINLKNNLNSMSNFNLNSCFNEISKKNYIFEQNNLFDKDEFISYPPPFP